MTRRYTEAQKAHALSIYEKDGPTAAEKQLGIPKSTVRKWARLAGISTQVTTRFDAAHAARAADLRARRADEAIKSMDLAKELRERVFAEREAVALTKDGDPIEYTVPSTPRDWRDALTAYGIALDKSLTLLKFDSDGGAQASKSMLEKLAEQIGIPNET